MCRKSRVLSSTTWTRQASDLFSIVSYSFSAVSEFEPAIMTLAYNVLKRILGNMRFGALRGFLKTPDTLMAKLKAKGRFVGAIADMMGVENVVIIIKAHIIGPKG